MAQNSHNVTKTSREMDIPRGNIQRWIKQKDLLKRMQLSRNINTRKAKRKTYNSVGKFDEIETTLLEWIREERIKGNPVTGGILRRKAFDIKTDLGDSAAEFKASLGWSVRFMRRHNLVRRAVTSIGQQIPEDAQRMATQFFADVRRQIENGNLAPGQIANMDEVPVYFDMPRNHTIDFKGLHTIKLNTTGHEHLRFTVVLTMLASGLRLKPMIIFKGLKNVPRQVFPAGNTITMF